MKTIDNTNGAGRKRGYEPGYVGFTYKDTSIISRGIAHFTREEADRIVVSHCFLVLTKSFLIEADPKGVMLKPITHYLDDPHTIVFFKKPIGLDVQKRRVLVRRASSHLGQKYDFSLILFFVEQFILTKILGRSRIFAHKSSWLNDSNEWICSELVADALSQLPDYRIRSPLVDLLPSQLSPMDLFKSDLFESWRFG